MKRRLAREVSPASKLTKLSEKPDHRDHTTPEAQPSGAVIYLVEKKIPSGQLSHLRNVARRKNIALSDSFNASVTHVVSALPSYERTEDALSTTLPDGVVVVNLQWLTSSFREGVPLDVTTPYRLTRSSVAIPSCSTVETGPKFELPEYECQRSTPLNHCNAELSEALEQLECYYQYKEEESRALAFRQASCTVKALPRKVTNVDEVSSLPRIGQHSRAVIQEILEVGYSCEVEKCVSSEWFNCIKLFTSVYGCGSATANRWYQQGLRTLEDVTVRTDLPLTETQTLGLKYHRDLSMPVPRNETAIICDTIERQAEACFPGTSVEAVGGYRRGKPTSHDVDLLLTHKDTSVTDCLLETLLTRLKSQGMVVHADVFTGRNCSKNIHHDHVTTSGHTFTPAGKHRRAVFDHLDKAFCILKLPTGATKPGQRCEERGDGGSDPGREAGGESEPAMIRRVDLIVSPPDQYPFALVSWTGSKQFNRSMRRYSVKECGMSVTAHGIYSITEGKFLPASTERDVFSILKLTYREPWDRNC